MSTLFLDYDELTRASSYASRLADKADEYADSLTKKVLNKVDSVTGGSNDILYSAKYYVNAKVTELQEKRDTYRNLSQNIVNLVSTARQVDKEVARALVQNKELFLEDHCEIKISDWKATIINWLVDLKNSCPVFELICDALNYVDTEISSVRDQIRYWYRCEGGKEIVHFAAAIVGAIVALALFIATLPASGTVLTFFAACEIIGAAMTFINAVVTIGTSYASMGAALSGDPAWAKVYGDQKSLAEVIRSQNFNNGFWNRVSYISAAWLDLAQTFCDVVNILKTIKEFKFKFDFLQNYFDKDKGLLSYMKTAKWTDALQYDEFGNITGVTKVMKVNEYGVVETHYTVGSIINGLKAYIMDKPIDAHSEQGIRTLLKENFKADYKVFRSTIFDKKTYKDTFIYNVTDGGRISYSEWKSTFNIHGIKDAIRYRIQRGSVAGIMEKGVEWEHKRDFFKTFGTGINGLIDFNRKAGSLFIKEYKIENVWDDNKDNLSDVIKIQSAIDKLCTDIQTRYKKFEQQVLLKGN